MHNNYRRSEYPNSFIPSKPNSSQYRHGSSYNKSYFYQPSGYRNESEYMGHNFYGRSMHVHSNQFYDSNDTRVNLKNSFVYRTQKTAHNFTNRSFSVLRVRPHLHAPNHSVISLPSRSVVSLPPPTSSPYHSMVVNDGSSSTRDEALNRKNSFESRKKHSKSENSENFPVTFSNNNNNNILTIASSLSSETQRKRQISYENDSNSSVQNGKQMRIGMTSPKFNSNDSSSNLLPANSSVNIVTVKSELVPFFPPQNKQITIPESDALNIPISTSSIESEELNVPPDSLFHSDEQNMNQSVSLLQPELLDSQNAPENESIASSIELTSITEDASKSSVSVDPDAMNVNPYGKCVFQHKSGRFCRTKTKNMFCKKHRELIQKLVEVFKYSIADPKSSSSQQIIATQLPEEVAKEFTNNESQCFEKKINYIMKTLECLHEKIDSISITCTRLERKMVKIEAQKMKSADSQNTTDTTPNSSTPCKSITNYIQDDDPCHSKILKDLRNSVDDTEIHNLISNRKFLLEVLGKYLIYSSISTLTVFDVRADTIAGIHKSKQQSPITCIHSCNSEGKLYLFCGSADKSLSCYISKNLVFTYTLELGKSISAIGSGKSLLFIGFNDGDLAAYSFSGVLQTSFKSCSFTSAILSIQCLRINNKDAAFVGTSSGEVKIVDGCDGNLLKSILQENSQIISMYVNKSKFYCGTFDGKFLIMDSSINTKKKILEGYRHINAITSIDCMKSTIVTSCLDRYVRTLNENGDLLGVYGATNDPIVDMKVFDMMIFFTTSRGSLLSLDPQYCNWIRCKWNNCNIHYINIKMLISHIIEIHCELSQNDSKTNLTNTKFCCKWNLCSFTSENISYKEIYEHLSVHIL